MNIRKNILQDFGKDIEVSIVVNNLYIVTFENESRVYTTETAAKECATILGKNAVITVGALYR